MFLMTSLEFFYKTAAFLDFNYKHFDLTTNPVERAQALEDVQNCLIEQYQKWSLLSLE